ncbi:hypothetical protein GYMLUDRAFT_64534 [Collybiopsis luxurians FD-317 M1]|uniref:Uncharacterized protein n=1 Tax=Collybiopsis luxurians FD-317 M1 TaxID=944289 RepID=A0A0D0ANV8_9AGAR|nr:hypothetical protein GYMLUDRAFT_64534 [Collybiopsis luxurians FD-317 M1]
MSDTTQNGTQIESSTYMAQPGHSGHQLEGFGFTPNLNGQVPTFNGQNVPAAFNAFGIQGPLPMMGSNNFFAAYANPYRNTIITTPTAPTVQADWEFFHSSENVVHPSSACPICKAFNHHFGEAYIENSPSWLNAMKQHSEFFQHKFGTVSKDENGKDIVSLAKQLGESNKSLELYKNKLESVQIECSELQANLNCASDDVRYFKGEIDCLRIERNSLLRQVQSMDKHITKIRDSDHQPKCRRIAENSVVNGNETQVEGNGITVPASNPTPHVREDGSYLASDGFIRYGTAATIAQQHDQKGEPIPIGKVIIPKGKGQPPEPTTVDRVLFYYGKFKEFDLPEGQPIFAFYNMIKNHRYTYKKIPVGQRTDAQKTLLANFYEPRFMKMTATTAEIADTPQASLDIVQNKGTPSRTVPVLEWAQYIAIDPTQCRMTGVYVRSDNGISMRTIRGRHNVYLQNPSPEKGSIALNNYKFILLSVELFAQTNQYRDLVNAHQLDITSPAPEPGPFNTDLQNATVLDVAHFYANQGFTINDANDTAFFAAIWIQQASSKNSEVALAMQTLQTQLIPVIQSGTIPAGIDNDFYLADGTVQNNTSNPEPGTTLFPIAPTVPATDQATVQVSSSLTNGDVTMNST